MNKSPFVSIIIPNYNGRQYLDTCLSSVLKTKYTQFELIMVDDCSTDESIFIMDKYTRHHANVKVLQNKKNIGAAASRNKAATIANGDILVFLDNDTEVDKNWLTEIVKTFLGNKKIGACQAKLMDFRHRERIQLVGVKLWAATGWGLPIGQGEKDEDQYDELNDIVAISAALAVKKSVFKKVGGFDELEAVVTEDLDLSWRIWIAGYKIILSPNAIVYHWTKSIVMRKNMHHTNEKIYFHLTKNSLTSIFKNYQITNMVKFFTIFVLLSSARACLVLVKRRDASSLKGTFRGYWWFLLHFDQICKNRKIIQAKRVFKDRYLFDTILDNSSIAKIYNKFFANSKLI